MKEKMAVSFENEKFQTSQSFFSLWYIVKIKKKITQYTNVYKMRTFSTCHISSFYIYFLAKITKLFFDQISLGSLLTNTWNTMGKE